MDRGDLERMVWTSAYRGADGAEYHVDGSIGLVSLLRSNDSGGACGRVLSVEDGGVLIADARLDNRAELAGQLGQHGSDSVSDLDVILSLLARGTHGAAKLIGDFACALRDQRHRELHLIRDAMGVRSLYFRVEPRRVLFATEVKQILAACGADRTIDERTVAWHLCGMQTPPGCTFYRGIDEVRPGEVVSLRDDGRVVRRTYWRPDPERRIRYRDEREYAEHLRLLFTDAMRCRLRGCSPVGVSLSGGIDSMAVAAVAGLLRESGERVPEMRAYSWAFNELTECDERANAYRVAARYSIPVREIAAESAEPLTDYPRYGPDEDDPFCGMYQPLIESVLASASEDGVSTIFYGNRGDMAFGGDVVDIPGLLGAGRIPDAIGELRALARILTLSSAQAGFRFLVYPMATSLLPASAVVSARNCLRAIRRSSGGRLQGRNGSERSGPTARAAVHVRNDFLRRAALPEYDPVEIEALRWSNAARRRRYLHLFSPLIHRVMLYADRLAASHRIGFADPWSDRRIAEFALAVPQYVANTVVEPKRLPHRSLSGVIPGAAIRSARKVTPRPLLERALRGRGYETLMSLFADSMCAQAGYIDDRIFRDRYERFVRKEAPIFDLWPTVSLEMWLRRYWRT